MAYIIYDNKSSKVLALGVTITAMGRISLNAGLTRIFQKNAFEGVLLLFDRGNRRIALRPATTKDNRSYRLSYTPSQASLSGKSFLNEFGWDGKVYKIPARWDAEESLVEFDMPRWETPEEGR